ncbi:hypothetical protein MTR67_001735 [Solanum verrucosum]|uniref:Uncharacterized protein n=1 Tax=Solanum verrucosum TaxID=315347 RepID=A0AAF0TCN5_SOLVR|nr:hypothetical protein MTR67_001735 [Solanum verrucosum]
MMTQDNRDVMIFVNPNVGTVATRVSGFTEMNPPEFHGSKVEEHSQEFINDMYNVLMILDVTPVEKEKLISYQLKGVAQV